MSWKNTLALGMLRREKCSRSSVSWGLGNALTNMKNVLNTYERKNTMGNNNQDSRPPGRLDKGKEVKQRDGKASPLREISLTEGATSSPDQVLAQKLGKQAFLHQEEASKFAWGTN